MAAWAGPGPGPGPNGEAREADLPKLSCRAGGCWARAETRSGSAGAARAGGPDLLGLHLLGRAGPWAPGRKFVPRGAPRSRPTQLQPLVLRSNKGAGPRLGAGRRWSRRIEPLAHEVVESPGLGGGERAAAACRGLSPAAGRGGASGSRRRLGNHWERCSTSLGSFLQTENSVVFGKLGACPPVSGLHLDCFVFGGTIGQEDCTSQGHF